MTHTAPDMRRRPRRPDIVALVVAVAGVAVAAWAVLTWLQGPVPETADFGTAEVSVDVGSATAGADTAGPTAGPATATATTGQTGPAIAGSAIAGPATSGGPTAGTAADAQRDGTPTSPGRRSASLADRPAQPATPVRLRVPAVGLDVPLDSVGVSDDGQMVVPEDADRAGWYRHGPVPGADAGSAVVAGHVDDRSGPGAFLALTEAEEGDEVVVDLDDGTSTTYRVVSRVTVAKPELSVDDLFRRDGPPSLRLITCTGDWSARTGHYTDNLVVTAEPVDA